jgi:hypothetical protein
MGDGERDGAEKKMQKSEKKFKKTLDLVALWCRILIKGRGTPARTRDPPSRPEHPRTDRETKETETNHDATGETQ